MKNTKKEFLVVSSGRESYAIATDRIACVRRGRGPDLFRPVIRLRDRTEIRVTSDSYEEILEKLAQAENVSFII